MNLEKEYKFLPKEDFDFRHIKPVSAKVNSSYPYNVNTYEYDENYTNVFSWELMVQGYLMTTPGKHLRIRRSGLDKRVAGTLCYKEFKSPTERIEFETRVSPNETTALLNGCEIVLKKERIKLYFNVGVIDIDRYEDGLITIEVEFYEDPTNHRWENYIWNEEVRPTTKQECISFFKSKFPFLGDYIGDDNNYSNISIAKRLIDERSGSNKILI